MAIHVTDAMLDALVQSILDADDEGRAPALLYGAARLLETAGYGIAPTHGSDVAGRLLMRAAEIEKLATELDCNVRRLAKGASYEH